MVVRLFQCHCDLLTRRCPAVARRSRNGLVERLIRVHEATMKGLEHPAAGAGEPYI